MKPRLEEAAAALATEPERAIGVIRARLLTAAGAGAFDPWLAEMPVETGKTMLLAGGDGRGKWKVQIFRVAADTSHPPHGHENLASCLVVLKGRLRAREFHRLREQERGRWAVLAQAFEGEFSVGEGMLTTESFRNVHWFGARQAPALAVNFKATGYFRAELMRFRNRRYLDPSGATGGVFRAPFISRAEACERFAVRPI